MAGCRRRLRLAMGKRLLGSVELTTPLRAVGSAVAFQCSAVFACCKKILPADKG